MNFCPLWEVRLSYAHSTMYVVYIKCTTTHRDAVKAIMCKYLGSEYTNKKCCFISDRYGRKWTMTISVGLVFAVGLGVAAAPSFLAVLILRVLLMFPATVSCYILYM